MNYKRFILRSVAIVVIVAVSGFAVSIYKRLHAFGVEDQIHGSFSPMAMALFAFERDHNAPATNLTQLVPRYLAQIPNSRFADSVEYSTMQSDKAWQLCIHSRALSKPRVYCCRSTQHFTADEERRVVLRYHAIWTVLQEQ
jgi:hypothetical protein